MKVGRNSIINSNISNFCSPSTRTHSHITRINPDKSTFLNSNLLISNILNHLSPPHPQDRDTQPDAYINREVESLWNIQHKMETKNKISRVHHLAKCRSQTTLNQMRCREKDIQNQVQQINVMKLQVNQKARDIMSRKGDTAYIGRNIFLQGEKFLKKMKEHNPAQKSNKIEATRMLMKQRAKTKDKHQIQLLVCDDNSLGSTQIQKHNHLNIQSTIGSFQKSYQHHHKKDQNQKEKQINQKMVTLIKKKSYQTVLAQQKRLATWNGFAQNWAQGFVKNDDLIITKKKKSRRCPQKYVDMNDNSQLNYHDKLSRHISLKKYCENFSKAASSYQIRCP